ncbi:MAG: FISUMP domain-containing protein [Candidatus Pacebacteria bacterium]|nr:FISUMP domain-containing protein [Candidatus Paceibacterota bacterium]MDD3072654.1 FISUMP domain-containing protein [Candidatus Paceibacterota bacterium]MDD3072656.1 FISUMP domain-containing protein [Candidatus Paceibacterota bacterium]
MQKSEGIQSKKKAFTLVELLIIISIIGILSMIAIMLLSSARLTARDTKTISQMSQIPSKISILYSIEGEYNQICEDENNFSTSSGLKPIQKELENRGKTIKCYAEGDNYCISTELNSGEYYIIKDNQRFKHDIPCQDAETGGGYWGFWQCGESFTDARDGKTYTTVLIGTQCFMAENLNVGTMITSCTGGYVGVCTNNGETPQNQGTSLISIEKYCYSDNEANCTTDGALYQWDQMMGGLTTPGIKGICPEGWHLPTDEEFKTLEMYLGMSQVQADTTGWRGTTEGDKLKKAGLCQGRTPCGTSGFNAILSGYRDTDGAFYDRTSGGYFWSSLDSGGDAWKRSFYVGDATSYRNVDDKALGFSVRCLKD